LSYEFCAVSYELLVEVYGCTEKPQAASTKSRKYQSQKKLGA